MPTSTPTQNRETRSGVYFKQCNFI